jgi:transcriptional regulator with XRE-family HTH domain
MSLEEKIIDLRKKGLSIKKISEELNCSKSTASKWCNKNNLSDVGLKKYKELTIDEILELKEYYKTHTKKETSIYFGISETTVIKHSDSKRVDSDGAKKNSKNYRLKRRIMLKIKSVDYKGGECTLCGYKKCIQALDFHHTNPSEKDFTISGNYNISWDRIKNELDKCILVCSNCHREIHSKEGKL